jgi:hypothetical protein
MREPARTPCAVVHIAISPLAEVSFSPNPSIEPARQSRFAIGVAFQPGHVLNTTRLVANNRGCP